MIDPEILQFIESTSKAMKSINTLVHTLHNKITDLEIKCNAMSLEIEHLTNANKPRVIK